MCFHNITWYKVLEQAIFSFNSLYSGELNVKPDNCDISYSVKFKGNCDRIDSLDGKIRIIDYKSGNVLSRDLVLKDWEMLMEGNKQDKIFQVLFYAYVYLKNQMNRNIAVAAGIISFRNMSAGFMPVKTPDGDMIDQNVLDEFENSLRELTKGLLNTEIPFSQTSNPDNYVYCPFAAICNR